MHILIITPYVTITGRPEFERNKTGFGYMVHDIAKSVGMTECVDVLATDSRGKGITMEGVHYIKRSIGLMARNIFGCVKPRIIFSLLERYPLNRAAKMRLWYYWMMTGYLARLLKMTKYDIVHIHGCTFADEFWMAVCREQNVKYIITLHGLNSFCDNIKIGISGKQYERDFLRRVVDDEFPITVISSGMKRLIEKAYGAEDIKNITVVSNSFSFASIESSKSIRKRYGIPRDGKVLLYVGNISMNKNQSQMVEAYCLLPNELRSNTWVLFCGRPSESGAFERHINSLPQAINGGRIVLCGSVEKAEMVNYYREADGVVLLSHSEGFGLSLIEGMHFGLPCVMFKDMDAYEDIYNEKAVVAIDTRDNEAVTEALIRLLVKQWNRDDIKEYSKLFNSQTMGQNYLKTFYQCINE